MPTKQFKWIDRDTAARDLLQLVYHAPPQIAEQAVKLLKAIRSQAIMPELKAIFLDQEYNLHLRTDIFNAICATPGNFDFSEFEFTGRKFPIFHQVFNLLKHHPVNVSWILKLIEARSIQTQINSYAKILEFVPEAVTEHIMKILTESEIHFDYGLGFKLYKFGGGTFQIWIEKNWGRILQSWLIDDIEYETKYWQRLRSIKIQKEEAERWPELYNAATRIQLDWLLEHFGSQNSLNQRLICFRLIPYSPKAACEWLMQLIEQNHLMLDLETAGLLHQYGADDIQSWLKSREAELIYLCLVDSVGAGHYAEKVRIVHILEGWTELKELLFQHAPAMVEEYEQKKAEYEMFGSLFRQVSDDAIRQQPAWKDIEIQHHEWLKSDENSVEAIQHLYNRDYLMIYSQSDVPQVAVKTYFLGTTVNADNDKMTFWLPKLLLGAGDQWCHEWVSEFDNDRMILMYYPVRFEAAYALRNAINPSTWKSFITAFLLQNELFGTYENRLFERYMLIWISRLTDMLSGVEPELPDEELPLNARPWFCALVKQNPSDMSKV